MIRTENLTKTFGGICAVNDISITLKEGEIFGLTGTNGAGKTTFLRLLSGIISQDKGTVLIDDEPVFDNRKAKENLFYVPSDLYFFVNSSPKDMGAYYATVYSKFRMDRFRKLVDDFDLGWTRRIQTYSKGMKRQLAILLGLCAGTKYIFMDETFDGLDPVMRQAVKSLIAEEMSDNGLTPVISSHNLREIEDVCDHVGLLHKGGILLSEDVADMKTEIRKLQCVFQNEDEQRKAEKMLNILNCRVDGRLRTYVVRGTEDQIQGTMKEIETVYAEVVPLTLEEIFISETEAVGYDVRKLILD
ncbi:ABC-2 type transport system ATP-binding protein [Lachnospiraceae bacterium]|nr:ABC-2 type transport system ATP-binding protein [Lachnospiraceae bacterium]